jgi:hypothetical protein
MIQVSCVGANGYQELPRNVPACAVLVSCVYMYLTTWIFLIDKTIIPSIFDYTNDRLYTVPLCTPISVITMLADAFQRWVGSIVFATNAVIVFGSAKHSMGWYNVILFFFKLVYLVNNAIIKGHTDTRCYRADWCVRYDDLHKAASYFFKVRHHI